MPLSATPGMMDIVYCILTPLVLVRSSEKRTVN